jgi:uncharacterized protein YjiS (DUF1127 family)
MSTNLNSLAAPGPATVKPRTPILALAQDLAARARRLWDAYWDYQARRATVRMLEALDNRTLKDIGLSRSEIRPAVFGSDAAPPRPYDPHWRKPPAVSFAS